MGTRSSREDYTDNSMQNGNGVAPSEEDVEPHNLSYYQMFKIGYQELVNAIIRPPRCEYDITQLGPTSFNFCSKPFIRRDFTLRNSRNLSFVCSAWEPVTRPSPVLPCVIYMHGNSSARVEAVTQLSLVLSLGATLVTFDFCGSGLSEGEYVSALTLSDVCAQPAHQVSLGWHERDDLMTLIEHLRGEGRTSTIALWGRSMGAATALLHGERDPSIAGMVLDSSFSELTQLAEEMVERGRQQGLSVPSFVVRIALRWIRSSVLKAAQFDIRELSPIQHADKCFIPALFVAAEGDDFVPPHHSQQIFDRYAGDKNIILVEGDHNSPRPRFLFDSAAIFLTNTLQIPADWILEGADKLIGLPPWLGDRSRSRRTHLGDIDVEVAEEEEGGLDLDLDLSDLTLDQILAMSIMDMGMTTDRQNEVRQALYTMLGDRQGIARHPGNSGFNDSAADSDLDVIARTDRKEDPASGFSATEELTVVLPGGRERGAAAAAAVIPREWTCPSCTLINRGITAECAACGQFRPQAPTASEPIPTSAMDSVRAMSSGSSSLVATTAGVSTGSAGGSGLNAALDL